MSTSGSAGGGGGGGGGGGTAARPGGGGTLRALPESAADGAGFGVGTDFGAAATVDFPGRGWAAGFGLAAGFGFYYPCQNQTQKDNVIILTESDGPPFRNSLPCVMGRTTPGFRFAGGLLTLLDGSPDAT